MTPPAEPVRYKNHRFPGEIISHGVWLYYRFSLSYRDVEEMMFARGIVVTHERRRQPIVRKWATPSTYSDKACLEKELAVHAFCSRRRVHGEIPKGRPLPNP